MGRARAAVVGLLLLVAAAGRGPWCGAQAAAPVELGSAAWRIEIEPTTLRVTARPRGQEPVELSVAQAGLGPASQVTQTVGEARWELPAEGCAVRAQLKDETLSLSFRGSAGSQVTWPAIVPGAAARAYLLPLSEGSYVPVDNAEWRAFLVASSPLSTTEGLSMPFLGLDCRAYTVSYLLASPFHNALTFSPAGGRIAARVAHTFVPREPDEYEVVVRLGAPSPVEPARQYRGWLMERGEFVSLQDKIEHIPAAEKLLGAAHVYLWGNDLLSRYDVVKWSRFAGILLQQARAARPSPGRRIWVLLAPEARRTLTEIGTRGYAYPTLTRDAATAISGVLARRDYYQAAAWSGVRIPPEARELLAAGAARLPTPRLLRLNCLLLEAAFPGEFVSSERWGDGVSVKMMERFAAAGLDRLWLGLDSWQGGIRHPQAIQKAKDLGYLIGTYDSYESVHSPQEPDTWETAQFDRQLYETGAVVGRDGRPRRGFQGKGYRLSPLAARPYVTARVSGLMQELPARFNSWFIDCDAYGDLEDDFSPRHPATQQDDMRARLERMQWIRDHYGLVIGSERGAAYAAPILHFAHGMLTPVIGWGDPDLQKNKQSPYYLGAWWPPDGPEVMMKQVPLKPAYRTCFFDPAFRIPLYETVFHDSLIATHHWQYASFKFSDRVQTTELVELLYGVPPLYHLNLDQFAQHGERILAHYRFFSPLHREVGLLPMTDFSWLTPDRLVQRTIFGERVEVVANFSQRSFSYRGVALRPASVLVRWRSDGRTSTYRPPPSAERVES